MRSPLRKFFLLFVVLCGMVTACSPAAPIPTATPLPTAAPAIESPRSTAIVMTDGLGRRVTLSQPAQRIISLAPSNTELLFAIGAGGQIIGRDSFSDYPPEAAALQDIGGPSFGSNMEMITKLQPDLILAAEINTVEQVADFKKLGLTVYYLSNPADLTGLYTNLEIVGKLTGREQKAAELSESFKKRIAAVDEKIAGITQRPVVFYEVDGTDPAKPWTTGPGSFMDKMIRQAGGVNAGGNLPIQWAQISQEELILQNPDLILLGDAKYGTTIEMVKQRAGWDAIKAVQKDRIITFNDDLISRPGPRLVDGLEALAKAIHPELFP
ncbi:MAG: cobalamin-binding protein [Leptolinea sp.]|jgi:iron complex transport system substrate-binding protein|nr:cobalamin-binding protein [Leptolinea sp.]